MRFQRAIQLLGPDRARAFLGRIGRGAVHAVGDVRRRHAARGARQRPQIDAIGRAHLAEVQREQLLALARRRQRGAHRDVEAPGAAHRLVEVVDVVGGADDDHVVQRREAVHLDQQAVDDAVLLLLAGLRLAAARALAQAVDLVDEDDARCAGASAREQLLHLADAGAVEHRAEVRAVHRDEVRAALAGQRARQQRLARAWRAVEQHAARGACAHRGVLRRVLHEGGHALQRLLRIVGADHVGEAGVRLLGQRRAAGAQRALALKVQQQPHQQRHRQQRHERTGHGAQALRELLDRCALVDHHAGQRKAVARAQLRQASGESGAAGGAAVDQARVVRVAALVGVQQERAIHAHSAQFTRGQRALELRHIGRMGQPALRRGLEGARHRALARHGVAARLVVQQRCAKQRAAEQQADAAADQLGLQGGAGWTGALHNGTAGKKAQRYSLSCAAKGRGNGRKRRLFSGPLWPERVPARR